MSTEETGVAEEEASTAVHIDKWLDGNHYFSSSEEHLAYVHFMMDWFRKPAYIQAMYRNIMATFKLFVTYEGKRYRVTGASRLGDVWLAKDLNRSSGYDHRVDFDLTKLTGWSRTP